MCLSLLYSGYFLERFNFGEIEDFFYHLPKLNPTIFIHYAPTFSRN